MTDIDAWIEREFAGHGRAIRKQSDTPFPDEPYMSMDDAKDLTRRAVAAHFNCCLNTPDPGPWKAGVDDAADDPMVASMHRIVDNLSYRTPILDFIWKLKAAVQIDNRTLLGHDIQRCLLSNAAHRLTLLALKIDPAPWYTLRDRIRDAWAVIRRRAVVTYVSGTVYDDTRGVK